MVGKPGTLWGCNHFWNSLPSEWTLCTQTHSTAPSYTQTHEHCTRTHRRTLQQQEPNPKPIWSPLQMDAEMNYELCTFTWRSIPQQLSFFCFVLFCFCFLGAAPVSYGGSQVRGLFGATAASLCHSLFPNSFSDFSLMLYCLVNF